MTTEADVVFRYGHVWALYRMYDCDGNLLYVGLTEDAGRRFGEHSAKRWFPLVATIKLEWFSNEARATFAERKAIAREQPRFNKAGLALPPGSLRRHRSPTGLTAWSAKRSRALDSFRDDLLDLLADGTTATKCAAKLGVTPWMGRKFLEQLRDEGLAHVVGVGRASHWQAGAAPDGDGS